jgi:ATP-dependent RNA helicase DeaD
MPSKKNADSVDSTASEILFTDLQLPEPIQKAISDSGYTTPSPIQAQAIPSILEGKDLVGLAQTGTGKTAAFSLPLLARLKPGVGHTQAIILAPTRELAMQVCEAIKTYAKYLPKLSVLPIYGGASYKAQLDGLRNGADIVVGTPGRVIDHLNRKSLKLENLETLILDEADEMLRMGFIEDVEMVLEHTPETRQVVLFSATMPPAISKIAKRYLNDPVEIRIVSETTTAPSIDQEYWLVDRVNKNTALRKFLTIKNYDAVILFARTKAATEELADTLNQWGYRAAALNGDMNQAQREKTVEMLKQGGLDMIVATDVAARGLDVKRISLVINYDPPSDPEVYTHRIGRTGRAGATGTALLFLRPKERYMIKQIERKTRGEISRISLPTDSEMQAHFQNAFVEKLQHQSNDSDAYEKVVADLLEQADMDIESLTLVLAKMLLANTPLDPAYQQKLAISEAKGRAARNARIDESRERKGHRGDKDSRSRRDRNDRNDRDDNRGNRKDRRDKADGNKSNTLRLDPKAKRKGNKSTSDIPMQRFEIPLGADQGVQPKHVVGCIANEGGIESKYIQNIEIGSDKTYVELPDGMPKDIFQLLKKARILGQKMNLKVSDD